jgi:hypothetical protein
MKLNTATKSIYTHQGAIAKHINPEQQLRRSVMSCLLWEKTFYENGEDIAKRITHLVGLVDPLKASKIAVEAREKMGLRHAPLWILRAMAKLPNHKRYVARTLSRICTRPDMLTDFLSLYWKDKKEPLSSKVKQGLAFAFQKFNEYQLAKYKEEDKAIKLRDVMFLCHPKPKDQEQAALWKRLANKELKTPDTWEVALSSGADKRETFQRLMESRKLGALAFVRNLRNMHEAGVPLSAINDYSKFVDVDKIFPWQFIAAARTNPQLEPIIEAMMYRCLVLMKPILGKTIVLVDVSGSMDWALSGHSDMKHIDAATGMAILLRQICSDVHIYSFSHALSEIPLRSGFALRDAILNSQPHGGTYLGAALNTVHQLHEQYDRIVVITDEQSADSIGDPLPNSNGYMINVACDKNGVGYYEWNHIDGFSSNVLSFFNQVEGNKYV